jgi:transcriptional regulator with XRE-family HTH domain
MSNNHTIVGFKIKGIRESKNISVEEIAERTGLSVEQINSIESDQYLPSLGPLIKVARALGVRLGTFLDDNDNLGPVVCRAEERNNSISFSNGASDAR